MSEHEQESLSVTEATDRLEAKLREQIAHTLETIASVKRRREEIGRLTSERRSEELVTTWYAERQRIIQSVNDPWIELLEFAGRQFELQQRQPSREDDVRRLMDEVNRLGGQLSELLWSGIDGGQPSPIERIQRSNRKITTPWASGSLFPIPNVQNHGTRNLGLILSGVAQWGNDPNGSDRVMAMLASQHVGYVDLTPGAETAERELLRLLSPRAIRTMIAVSRLIYEGTNHLPLNRGTTLTVGEIARAMGYKAGKDRSIDPATLQSIATDVYLLSKTCTWAADGPYDRKSKSRQSGWISPLIAITAVHVEQSMIDGVALPIEFDAMLGRNWAQAVAETDFLQVAPGFLELTEESTIRLAWYYLTEFRYRMTKRQTGPTRKIPALCQEACINPGLPRDRGRFLGRLEGWHKTLHQKGVIGNYERTPSAEDVSTGQGWTPKKLFAEGEYRVTPPAAILQAYEASRQKALGKGPKRKV